MVPGQKPSIAVRGHATLSPSLVAAAYIADSEVDKPDLVQHVGRRPERPLEVPQRNEELRYVAIWRGEDPQNDGEAKRPLGFKHGDRTIVLPPENPRLENLLGTDASAGEDQRGERERDVPGTSDRFCDLIDGL